MKLKKKILIPIIIILAALVVMVLLRKKGDSKNTTYTFAEVTRGDIQNTVDATGTIEPVTTVEVGTQVSGIIDNIYVDFNDRVTKNQLLAVIDTTILSVQVRDARASLLRSQAEYDKAKFNYERTEDLYKQNLLSELEYITAKSTYQSARASLLSSQNSLERAERNMRYAFIRSPINGTVIYREVEEGQTVASSFQTPRLFLIAEDLSKMEIHALVDESEIGQIKVGQSIEFEVQAFDDKKFYGTVRQVWLQPETVQNVVTYTVVVDADNPEGLLLPGMTATIEFIIEAKKGVLLAPVAATKLQPTESMMKIMAENMRERFSRMGGSPDSSGGRNRNMSAMASTDQGTGSRTPTMNGNNMAVLWFFDENKDLKTIPVKTGATDGRNVEITPLPGFEITEGLEVISKIETPESQVSSMPGPVRGFGRGPF